MNKKAFRETFGGFIYPPIVQLSEQFNYGHREVLLAANNLDPKIFFLGCLQHGWVSNALIQPTKNIKRNRLLRAYPHLVWTNKQRDFMIENGYKTVQAIGSPWSHLLKACKVQPGKRVDYKDGLKVRKRTLYFPRHSIPGVTTNQNFDLAFLSKASSSSDLTVCLFWLDFVNPEVVARYQSTGAQVICLGYKGNVGIDTPWAPNGGRVMFLPNLLSLLNEYEIVATDEISTLFWYAASLGKTLILTAKTNQYEWWGEGEKQLFTNPSIELLASSSRLRNELKFNEPFEISDTLLKAALEEIGWQETQSFCSDTKLHVPFKQIDFLQDLSAPVSKFIIKYKDELAKV